jgi:hypothetical protein
MHDSKGILALLERHGVRHLSAPFPRDLLVRTPKNLQWRLEEGESLHTEIVGRAKFFIKNAAMEKVSASELAD